MRRHHESGYLDGGTDPSGPIADEELPPEILNVRDFLQDLIAILKGWVEASGNPLELGTVDTSLTLEGYRIWLTLSLVSAIFYLTRSHPHPISLSAEARWSE